MSGPTRRGPLAAGAAGIFGAIAGMRGGARAVHPKGFGYRGELRMEDGGPAKAPLLAAGRSYPAVTRLSRAIGLPEGLPDILGVAFRLPDAHGREKHQDLLFASSSRGPVLQHLLLPGRGGFLAQPYSSLLPYRVGEDLLMMGVLPVTGSPHPYAFRLALAPLRGGWRPIGTLTLEERAPDAEIEALQLNPWNTGGGLYPAGPLMGLRDAAYRGSQRVRTAA